MTAGQSIDDMRIVPKEHAGAYLNLMGMSWLFNFAISFLFFGAIPSAFGLLIITLLTDFFWWIQYPHKQS